MWGTEWAGPSPPGLPADSQGQLMGDIPGRLAMQKKRKFAKLQLSMIVIDMTHSRTLHVTFVTDMRYDKM